MRRATLAMLVWATILVVASCAGKKEGEEDEGDVTDDCVPYCERRQAGGCNELGTVDSCRLACGLLLTDETPCGAASKVLLDCRLSQANICRGCGAQQDRATAACTM